MSLFTQISQMFTAPPSDPLSIPVVQPQVQTPVDSAKIPNTTSQLSSELAGELHNKIQELAHKNEQLMHAKETMLTLLKNASDLEAALHKERDKSVAIMSSMGEGMIVIDPSMRVSFINHIAEKLLALESTQGVGTPLNELLQLIYDPTKEDRTAVLSEAISKGITTMFHLDENFLLKTSKGQTFPVSLTLTPLPEKNGGVLLFRDITPERLVKESIEKEVMLRTRELMEEQAKLTASIDSLQRGFIMTDTKGEILLTNAVLNSMLGVIREPWSLSLVQEKLGGTIDLLALYKECQKTNKPKIIPRVQFGSRFLRVSLNPFFMPEHHTLMGILIQLEDITDDVVLQRSRDEFFSIASHELRTPLTSIRGNISLIKQFYPQVLSDKNLAGMIEDIHTSSIRLISIVNEFLNLSRLELGKIIFKKELFDIVPVIQSCIKEVGQLANDRNLTLTFDAHELKQLFVYADTDRLREVIVNLLSNGIKFTENGGVRVILEKGDTYVRVLVQDTGRGIPLKNQSLLFRKFQQASDNLITRDTRQSTGLGLYISKLLMQGMGGSIGLVTSEENKGATFEIKLPVPD